MLKKTSDYTIPAETVRIVRKAFPKGNLYIRLRDELGSIFQDEQFSELYSSTGQPGWPAWRLALVTIMQFMENLTDRQTAEAIRARLDWKYALGLKLDDPGIDHSVLNEFRERLLEGGKEWILLERLLEVARERKLLGTKTQRTDSTYILARIRQMKRLEVVGEAMRRVLDDLAMVAPEWLRAHQKAEWIPRYGRPIDLYRLPKSQAEQVAWAEEVGRDGFWLLERVQAEDTPAEIRGLPSLEVLRRIWIQQYYREGETIRWRTEKEGLPPAHQMIASPDDLEARYAGKAGFYWTGYKVHFTETCEAESPHLITDVETTPATTADARVLEDIQARLQQRQIAPEQHLLDSGYASLSTLMTSRERGIELLAPLLRDRSWQARQANGYDHTHFQFDWERQVATCPQGQTSRPARKGQCRNGLPTLTFAFDLKTCQACAVKTKCTRAKKSGRQLTVLAPPLYEFIQEQRQRQQEEGFEKRYRKRAGIEGTFSQAVRGHGLRQARYLGLARTHLQNLATAAAINLARLYTWLCGKSRVSSRPSAYLTFATAPA